MGIEHVERDGCDNRWGFPTLQGAQRIVEKKKYEWDQHESTRNIWLVDHLLGSTGTILPACTHQHP